MRAAEKPPLPSELLSRYGGLPRPIAPRPRISEPAHLPTKCAPPKNRHPLRTVRPVSWLPVPVRSLYFRAKMQGTHRLQQSDERARIQVSATRRGNKLRHSAPSLGCRFQCTSFIPRTKVPDTRRMQSSDNPPPDKAVGQSRMTGFSNRRGNNPCPDGFRGRACNVVGGNNMT